MKPSRKLRRGSFVHQVSGGHAPGGGAMSELIGKGKPGAPVASDHDLGGPPVKGSGGGGAAAVDYDA
jgi:hypothetical protein